MTAPHAESSWSKWPANKRSNKVFLVTQGNIEIKSRFARFLSSKSANKETSMTLKEVITSIEKGKKLLEGFASGKDKTFVDGQINGNQFLSQLSL